MEKKYAGMLFVLIFLGIVSVVNLARQDSAEGILDRESRRITAWPEWNIRDFLSGLWARRAEDAFADRFLFREKSLSVAARIAGLKGLPAKDGIRLVEGSGEDLFAGDAMTAIAEGPERMPLERSAPLVSEFAVQAPVEEAAPPKTPADAPPKAPAGASPPPDTAAGEPWTSKVLIYENRGYETAWYTEYAAQYYAGAIAHLDSKINPAGTGGKPNIPIYVMIIPSSIEFLEDERYRNLSYPQAKGIRDIYAKLPAGTVGLDVTPELQKHRDKYIYHKTDHHWTGLGAWYAYKAAAEALGITPHPYDAFPKETIPNFLGTMYNRTRAPELQKNPDTVELVYPFMDHVFTLRAGAVPVEGKAVDKEYIQGFNIYLAYINGDYPHADIRTTVKNGKKILILKDSYANAFVPYLIPHYEEIHIIDPRYWIGSVPAFVKDKGINEVLVFNYYLVVSVFVGFARNLYRVTGD